MKPKAWSRRTRTKYNQHYIGSAEIPAPDGSQEVMSQNLMRDYPLVDQTPLNMVLKPSLTF